MFESKRNAVSPCRTLKSRRSFDSRRGRQERSFGDGMGAGGGGRTGGVADLPACATDGPVIILCGEREHDITIQGMVDAVL